MRTFIATLACPIASHGAGKSRNTASTLLTSPGPKPSLQTFWCLSVTLGSIPCAENSALEVRGGECKVIRGGKEKRRREEGNAGKKWERRERGTYWAFFARSEWYSKECRWPEGAIVRATECENDPDPVPRHTLNQHSSPFTNTKSTHQPRSQHCPVSNSTNC